MGTRIEAAATAHRDRLPRGALHLTDAAARACLSRAHVRAEQLDLLINTGIYKDFNAAEPALAAIIQEDLGANPGSPIHPGSHGTFSFDVVGGACGVIHAAQLVDAFVGHGQAHLGMIVAGDADPSPSTSRHFPFAAAAGAVVITHTDDDTGFSKFRFRTFPKDAALFESTLRWDPSAGLLHRGRNVIQVIEAPEFAERCIGHAVDVARELLADASLDAADVDLLLASQYPPSFGVQVARRLGVPIDRVPVVASDVARAHTAGPIAALEAAIDSNRFATARHTLFVTAGAGIAVGVALYRS